MIPGTFATYSILGSYTSLRVALESESINLFRFFFFTWSSFEYKVIIKFRHVVVFSAIFSSVSITSICKWDTCTRKWLIHPCIFLTKTKTALFYTIVHHAKVSLHILKVFTVLQSIISLTLINNSLRARLCITVNGINSFRTQQVCFFRLLKSITT